jgi:hypothetical protein
MRRGGAPRSRVTCRDAAAAAVGALLALALLRGVNLAELLGAPPPRETVPRITSRRVRLQTRNTPKLTRFRCGFAQLRHERGLASRVGARRGARQRRNRTRLCLRRRLRGGG